MLKLINSKTFRLSQLLSEKVADGITVNVKNLKLREKECANRGSKQYMEGRASGGFHFGQITQKWRASVRGVSVLKISPNSCHREQLIPKPSITQSSK